MVHARALAAALMAAVAVSAAAREAAGQPADPKKYALLIGMNTYSNGFITGKVPELRWAVDDAKALAVALTDLGYDTTIIPKTEATRRRIIEALNYFATKATENDSFILYYAGHGVRNKIINEKTYWLTWDSELESLDPSGLRGARIIGERVDGLVESTAGGDGHQMLVQQFPIERVGMVEVDLLALFEGDLLHAAIIGIQRDN